MTVSIDFTWYKDASGYRLVKKGSLPDGKPRPTESVPNGGERILIRPMETADIYMDFCLNVDSAEKLLEFVERVWPARGLRRRENTSLPAYYQRPELMVRN